MPIAKVTDEQLTAIGAANAAEFPEKLSAFIAEFNSLKLMADSKVTLETLQASLTSLEGKMLTEAKVKELIAASGKAIDIAAMTEFANSAEGKKIIGAEASRITMEALAGVGTQPAKPAPASSDNPEENAKALIEAGKFEEAYALDKNLQAEFPNAKVFAAYAKASSEGRVTIGKSK